MTEVKVPKRPGETNLTLCRILGSVITRNRQAWAFPPDGAQIPASRTRFLSTLSSTGSSVNFLMLLLFLIAAQTSISQGVKQTAQGYVEESEPPSSCPRQTRFRTSSARF